jgi:hypothetical protein
MKRSLDFEPYNKLVNRIEMARCLLERLVESYNHATKCSEFKMIVCKKIAIEIWGVKAYYYAP